MIRIYLCAVASLNRSNLLHHCFFQVSLTHSFRKWFTRIIKCTFVLSENPVSWSYNSGKYCMTDSLKMWLIFSFVYKNVDRPRWDKTCDCSMTTSTITSLGTFEVFFFPKVVLCSSTRLLSQKTLLCKSHSQVWTQSDGQSSHWCRGSRQSLAYIFQEICDSCCGKCLLMFFSVVFSTDSQSMFVVFVIMSTNCSLL